MPLYFVGGLGSSWTSTAIQLELNDETGRYEIVQLAASQFGTSLADTMPSAFAIEGADVVIAGGRSAVLSRQTYGNYDGTFTAFGGSVGLYVEVGAGDLWVAELGTLQVEFGGVLPMTGNLTNEGALTVRGNMSIGGDSILNTSVFSIDDGGYVTLKGALVTVTGEGSIQITDAAHITSDFNGVTELNNQSTISGETGGSIRNIAISNGNLGIIEANGNFGTGGFYIGGSDGENSDPVHHGNQGILRAVNGGVLDIGGVIEQQGAGSIEAHGTGSVVKIVDVSGGTLETTDGGQIWFSGNLGGTETASQVDLTDGLYLLSEGGTFLGAIHNPNTIHVSLGLGIGPEVTLTGGGEIRLGHERSFSHISSTDALPHSFITGARDGVGNLYGTASFINTDNTISGAGTIGVVSTFYDLNLAFENQADGIVQADVAGKKLQINGVTEFINDGLVQAISGATLQIANNFIGITPFDTLISNSGGEVRADGAGSVVLVTNSITADSDVAIHGGLVRAQNGGDVIFAGGLLDGTTTEGAATLNGDISASSLFLRGETINQGTIHLRESAANASSGGKIYITSAGAELTGGGIILMDETTGQDSITGAAQTTTTALPADYTPSLLTLTDQLITGGGLIWSEFSEPSGYPTYAIQLTLGTDGEVRATAGHTMTIGTKYLITNNGTLQAMGGTMKIYDQVSGTGSVVLSNGGRLEVRADFGQDITFSAQSAATAETLVFTDWEDDQTDLDYNRTINGMGVGDRVFFADAPSVDVNLLLDSANKFTWVENGTGGTITLTGQNETLTYQMSNVLRAELELIYDDVIGLGFARRAATKGTANGEQMAGTAGNDRIISLAGNDILMGSLGNDVLDGGSGNDLVNYAYSSAGVNIDLNIQDGRAQISTFGDQDVLFGIEHLIGSNAADVFTGSGLANALDGGNGGDYIDGRAGNDFVFGGAGVDTLIGDTGDDTIGGGLGTDRLYGGIGADDFVFEKVYAAKGTARDVVYDFAKGFDDLDLRLIDANTKKAGDQAFVFNATKAKAFGVWYQKVGSGLVVSGDVNGDGKADFEIGLFGSAALVANDFML